MSARSTLLRALLGALFVLLLGLAGAASAQECDSPESCIQVERGAIPIILSAPHAGTATISGIAARDSGCGLGGPDFNTRQVAEELADAIETILGKRPYSVVAKFQRRYVDVNRDKTTVPSDPDCAAHESGVEAYNDLDAERYYDAYHDALDDFAAEVASKWSRAIVLDIHGNSAGPSTIARGTADGATVRGFTDAEIAGPNSIFGRLAAEGYDVYPPNTPPGPTFLEGLGHGLNGAFITRKHGASDDGVDAMQIEYGCHLRRDEARTAVVRATANAIAVFNNRVIEGVAAPRTFFAVPTPTDLATLTTCSASTQLGHAVVTGDFDGDGHEDVATSMPYASVDGKTQAGRVRIQMGHDEGLTALNYVDIDQETVNATSEPYDRFGWTLAAGDLNADGYDDLVIGIPYEDDRATDDGMIVAVYGSPQGFDDPSFERLNQTRASASSEAYDRFGYSLAVGNFDGDAYADVAVGVPYEDDRARDEGMAVIFYGSYRGLIPSRWERIGQSTVGAVQETGDRFAWSLAAGDLDGDGYDDLVVGVPYEDDRATDDGMIVAVFGSAAGLVPARYERLNQTHARAASEAGDRFGYRVATGNFDGDAYADVAVSVPYEDVVATDEGMVVIFYGSYRGLIPSRYERISQSTVGARGERGDRFGWSLATGRIDTDRYDDLVVGVPYEDDRATDDGMIVALYGSYAGLVPARYERLGQARAGAASEAYDRFGMSVAVADVDRDGDGDVLVGAPREDVTIQRDAGALYLLEATRAGLID
jgi:N-formylglutamate amidohydrolase